MASSLRSLLLLLCSLALVESKLRLFDLRASDLPTGLIGNPDSYVKVSCGTDALGKTSISRNNANPWWGEEFTHFMAQQNDVLKLEVYDSDVLLDDRLGICQRQIRVGTHKHDCYLEEGGTLHYTYTLSEDIQ